MRFYDRQHRFYCGIDLHARTMYVCIVDLAGTRLVHQDNSAQRPGVRIRPELTLLVESL